MTMMDYVFFHQQPLDLFVEFLRGKGLAPSIKRFDNRIEVLLPDDLQESLFERIDERYHQLIDMEGEMTDAEQPGGADNYQMGGVTVNLKYGKTVYADVEPDLLSRCWSLSEPRNSPLLSMLSPLLWRQRNSVPIVSDRAKGIPDIYNR